MCADPPSLSNMLKENMLRLPQMAERGCWQKSNYWTKLVGPAHTIDHDEMHRSPNLLLVTKPSRRASLENSPIFTYIDGIEHANPLRL